ncbi:MAG: D-alanine--D-alanine ligase [Bacteroidetes bacterium]|nr:D-alanine--D-alanine ligase [Bacteroidota bacterium]MBK9504352.1 D-alanine--D-alanine ligase [Bacteroidota bacterium]MBK9556988.1 D-alanine--D-alanine ligase [Bacteroidota bacterium]MBP9878664.1 D-alanine--D-alanine ligase [Chitinophagales bacterium]
MKKNVAVICGGYTAERNISLGSGDVVTRNLDPQLYHIYKVLVNTDGCYVQPENIRINMSDFSFDKNGETIKFDLVFNAIHGSPGEDGRIQGYFDMLQIPYTNCSAATSALTFNKVWTKKVLAGEVNLAKGKLVKSDEIDMAATIQEITEGFRLPLFVKPNNNGSSYGISKIKEFDTLKNAVTEALKFDTEVLVEEGITGTEVTCGVYRYKGEIIVLPICEIVAGKHDFFDYTAKYTAGESDEIIPARIPETEAAKVANTSSRIYQLLNCKGVVRIDYIISNGEPFFLEVNTVPGISEASIVPKMAVASGLTLQAFFGRLLDEAKAG